jgi:SAM-dependent methyltransferase
MSFSRIIADVGHASKIQNQLYQYDDFMASIKTLVDLGCGTGQDLEWWATATTRDEVPEPLNITCVGVDQLAGLPVAHKYPNITYQQRDFEIKLSAPKEGFDILWCHDAFQYALDPIKTLSQWWEIASDGAMLILSVPETVRVYQRKLFYSLPAMGWYHHTLVSLIRMLAVSGWDCNSGFFQQLPGDPWISAIVYKSSTAPMNPKNVTWYELSDTGLLPESARASIQAHGYLRQQDLVLPWIDKSIQSMAQL